MREILKINGASFNIPGWKIKFQSFIPSSSNPKLYEMPLSHNSQQTSNYAHHSKICISQTRIYVITHCIHSIALSVESHSSRSFFHVHLQSHFFAILLQDYCHFYWPSEYVKINTKQASFISRSLVLYFSAQLLAL